MLQVQMSNVLRMASGQVDSQHVSEMESQLHEARAEVQSLTAKLNKLSSSEVRWSPLSPSNSVLHSQCLELSYPSTEIRISINLCGSIY